MSQEGSDASYLEEFAFSVTQELIQSHEGEGGPMDTSFREEYLKLSDKSKNIIDLLIGEALGYNEENIRDFNECIEQGIETIDYEKINSVKQRIDEIRLEREAIMEYPADTQDEVHIRKAGLDQLQEEQNELEDGLTEAEKQIFYMQDT